MKPGKSYLLAALIAFGAVATVGCSPNPTRESFGEYVDDATITTRVKKALADDRQVKATEVNVETYRGVVQLSGFVATDAEIKRAAELAQQVPGVRSVKNDVRLKSARPQ